MNRLKQKIVFLDRDGVINQDSPDYIKNWSEFKFLPGSVAAIRNLTANGFDIMIITNQSVINRNMVSTECLEDIFTRMKREITSNGGEIKDIFYCPHLPDEGCNCRKPKPGLIELAQKKYGFRITPSYMVGDSAKDIECAINAGCPYSILVKTGNGVVAEKILAEKNIYPYHIVDNLNAAADWIISHYSATYSHTKIPT